MLNLVFRPIILAAASRRYRGGLRSIRSQRSLGGGQLLVGLLWVAWGVLYLQRHGTTGAALDRSIGQLPKLSQAAE